MNLLDELTHIADDFDRLSDPARDDMTFIYNWEPPEWFPDPGLDDGEVYTAAAAAAAAVIREAIKRLTP